MPAGTPSSDIWVAGTATDSFGNQGGFSVIVHLNCNTNPCTMGPIGPGL
jgi:hypothetical protein